MPDRYIWSDGCWRDREGEPMPMPDRTEVCCPMVHSDIKEYPSPIDGKMITSRSQRRYDLESNGCIDKGPPPKKRGYINPSFTGKRGLPLREDWKEAIGAMKEGMNAK